MVARQELLVAASSDPGEVFAVLSAGYTVVAEPNATASWICLDSADWRLHRSGLTLRVRRSGRTSELILDSDADERWIAPAGPGGWPRQLHAIPASPLRDQIALSLGVRALLPRAEVQSRSIPLRLLDQHGKTRVRLRIDQQRLSQPNRAILPLRLLVSPVRGYERDAERCTQLLTDRLALLAQPATAAHAALLAAGQPPGSRPGAPAVSPVAPADESVVDVLRHQLDVMDSCREGALADTDPEYLHDLRIAVRFTRSFLRSAADLLAGDLANRYGGEFAWLGKVTSPIRDLDVLLLTLQGHSDLDLAGLDGLDPLRALLRSQRNRELRALRTALRSKRATDLQKEWRRSLEQLRRSEGHAEQTGEFARQAARQAYRRILREARLVTQASTAEDLHALRKRCKRMRYLLDGFWTAFDPSAATTVQRPLKRAQTGLGDIQDCDVQRRQLRSGAAALAAKLAPIETLLQLGALGERLDARTAHARRQLQRRIADLTGSATAAAVDALAGGDQ